MFDADRPIIKSEQDCLNRSIFAKYLARCMLNHEGVDSFVVGLYGGWGVGKTSVLNLVLEELNFAASNLEDVEKPIILNFSPWSYSGQEDLTYHFFRRLSSVLRSAPHLDNRDRIIELLELYVSFFTDKPVPKSLRSNSWINKLLKRKNEENYAWESGRDLTLIKQELNELLSKQNHKILILIDNISRLYDNEIKQIFQIIKSMGDYANSVYLLALDKERVTQAIDHLDGSGGAEFVEKIVQLPFVVPPILQQDLENIFADKLKDIIKTVPNGAWNTEYWADIYYSCLRYFFENCRDITRYVNTLNFGYPHLRDMVNPVDFFALTAIEVFAPQIYFGIRDNKDLFTDLFDHVYKIDEEEIKKDKARCNEILARDNRIPKEIMLNLLMQLFPRLHYLYQPDIPFYHSETIAHQFKRVCSPDLFDIYFRLSMQAGQIVKSEFDTILAEANNVESFDHALARLNQDEKISKFLDQLDNKKVLQKIPQKNIPAIIHSLIDNGDLFPHGISGPINLSTPMRIHRIIHGLLQRIEKSEDRFAILQSAIAKATKSLYIIIYELKEQQREHNPEADNFMPTEFRDLASDQLASLQKLTVSRIQAWAADGRLISHPQLIPILFAWRDWGNEEEYRMYVYQATQSDQGLVAFLAAALAKPVSEAMTKYHKNPSWHEYLSVIEAFIPPKNIEEHAKALFEDPYFEKLRESEQLALMIFLDLMHTPTKKIIPKTTA